MSVVCALPTIKEPKRSHELKTKWSAKTSNSRHLISSCRMTCRAFINKSYRQCSNYSVLYKSYMTYDNGGGDDDDDDNDIDERLESVCAGRGA